MRRLLRLRRNSGQRARDHTLDILHAARLERLHQLLLLVEVQPFAERAVVLEVHVLAHERRVEGRVEGRVVGGGERVDLAVGVEDRVGVCVVCRHGGLRGVCDHRWLRRCAPYSELWAVVRQWVVVAAHIEVGGLLELWRGYLGWLLFKGWLIA